MSHLKHWTAGVAVLSLFCAPVSAQDDGQNRSLTLEEFAQWRSITSTGISDDGRWISYGYRKRDADDQLFVVNLETDKKHEIERGSAPAFSSDGKWVAYTLNLSQEEAEKLREDDKPVPRKAVLMDLDSGDKIEWDNVSGFEFSPDSRSLVVRIAASDPDAEHGGANVILRDLSEGLEELIGSVQQLEFNDAGSMLAYTVDAADQNGNGLYLIYPETGVRRALDNGKNRYARLTWDEEGSSLAVLKGNSVEGMTERGNTLIAFAGLNAGRGVRTELDPSQAFGFPTDMVISEKAALSWNQDCTKVFFGIKEQEKEREKSDEPVADVDIFHWNDDRLQSVQKNRANTDRNFTYRSAFNVESGNFVRLADQRMRTVSVTRDGKWAVGQDQTAYVSDWQERRADFYRVDTDNGERTPMLIGHGRTFGLSPDSRYFLFWQEGHVWKYDLETTEELCLTEEATVTFDNAEYDHPGERPAYGVTGWTADGSGVILRHRYDLWLQPLDGSAATNLTGGRGSEGEIVFRYVRTDPDERFIDLSEPMLLSAYGQWTKKSGYYTLSGGELQELIYVDKRFGGLAKAENADRYMYNIQDFREFPDYYVSDGAFANPKRVTDANPEDMEFTWGRRILFDYTNKAGVRLQGTLGIPDDHVEGQKLPMLVNFYEKNSQNLHRYPAPRYASSPQFAWFVSNGYLVMQPDVHFNTRTTADDMLDCVEAAVRKVIEMGYVDPARIGLHGHSFSGFGAAFISTRSKMFAAIIAGAAPINLVSEFNELFQGSGQNNHRYDIYGQGRYGTNPYDDFELYWSQSPISGVRNMDTPLLYLHGVDDPTVEYLQGMEFYNALRFNGKPVIFLSYPGEGHGLRRLENQKDFLSRMHEFYQHHLNGVPAPDWMEVGVPFLKKAR